MIASLRDQRNCPEETTKSRPSPVGGPRRKGHCESIEVKKSDVLGRFNFLPSAIAVVSLNLDLAC